MQQSDQQLLRAAAVCANVPLSGLDAQHGARSVDRYFVYIIAQGMFIGGL